MVIEQNQPLHTIPANIGPRVSLCGPLPIIQVLDAEADALLIARLPHLDGPPDGAADGARDLRVADRQRRAQRVLGEVVGLAPDEDRGRGLGQVAERDDAVGGLRVPHALEDGAVLRRQRAHGVLEEVGRLQHRVGERAQEQPLLDVALQVVLHQHAVLRRVHAAEHEVREGAARARRLRRRRVHHVEPDLLLARAERWALRNSRS